MARRVQERIRDLSAQEKEKIDGSVDKWDQKNEGVGKMHYQRKSEMKN